MLQKQTYHADIVLAEGSIRYVAPLEGIAHAQTTLNLITGNTEPLIAGKNAIDYDTNNTRILYGQNNQNIRLRGTTIELGEASYATPQHVTASSGGII